MKRTIGFLILCILSMSAGAQPEPYDSGLFILQIYVKGQQFRQEGKSWRSNYLGAGADTTQMYLKHSILTDAGEPRKKPFLPVDPEDYNIPKPVPLHAIFLPPFIDRKETPHQRIELFYAADTMTVDFVDIPKHTFMDANALTAIHFKPGKFVFRLWGDPKRSPKDTKEVAWLNHYRYIGITPEAEPYLLKYGVLEYTPPRNLKSTWKYVRPLITVEQSSPYVATVKLQGNFLGRLTGESYEAPEVRPYFKVESLQNGKWVEKPFGIGVDFQRDADNVTSMYFEDHQLLQLATQVQVPTSGFLPGQYRVSVVTAEKAIITSREITLGMLPSTSPNPYQILYREGLGFANYRLDAQDDIHITTPYLPLKTDEGTEIYHFQYFSGLNYDFSTRNRHPEEAYTSHFIPLVSARKVSVNGKPFSGRIKYAFGYSQRGVPFSEYVIDIHVVDYVNGVPKNSTVLKDVELITESHPMRPQGR